MRFEAHLAQAAARQPDKVVLVHAGGRTTYRELHALAAGFAARLRDGGFAPGDRCLICLDNRLETAVAIFGTLLAGGVFTVVNPTTKAGKLGFLLADSGAAAMVHQASNRDPAATVAAPGLREGLRIDVDASPIVPAGDDVLPRHGPGVDIDLAMLVYTSGSTGRPKGVMMTHQNLQHASESITGLLGNVPEDVVLSVLPLSFNYGLYQLLMTVRVGMTLVLERSLTFPRALLKKIGDEGVTGLPVVPTIAALLVPHVGVPAEWTRSVRYITNTAASLPPAHIALLGELFPSAAIFSMYGITESKRCTCLPPSELVRRPTSVGVAIPNSEVWLVDDAGQRITTPHTTGELVVRGGHVMQGYWNLPEETARTLRPGRHPWERVLHTGDLFEMDEDGFLYFLGRKDDIIKSRGEKVSPKEVEDVLYELPGVQEAVLVGVPDAVLGMALRAVIVRREGQPLEATEVVRHCAARLEDYMVPQQVEFRDALPKTDTGKLSRRALLEELGLAPGARATSS